MLDRMCSKALVCHRWGGRALAPEPVSIVPSLLGADISGGSSLPLLDDDSPSRWETAAPRLA